MTDYKDIKYKTLVAGDIPNLDTAKTTTGTFADARISSGSVTQHVTAFDDTDLRSDIMTLALKEAITENRVAYNLPNAMIEQFQDDSKIGTETTGDRNASEYWSTIYDTVVSYNWKTAGTHGHPELRSPNTGQSQSSHGHSDAWTNDRVALKNSGQSAVFPVFLFDLSQDFSYHTWNMQDDMSDDSTGNTHDRPYQAFTATFFNGTEIPAGKNPQYGGADAFRATAAGMNGYGYVNADSIFDYIFTDAIQTAVTGDSFTAYSVHSNTAAQSYNITGNSYGSIVSHYYNDGTGVYGLSAVNTASTNTLVIAYLNGAGTGTSSTAKRTVTHSGTGRFHILTGDANNDTSGRYQGISARHTADGNQGSLSSLTTNATGTLISTAQTANAAQTKVSGVILYKNNEGTATLGTDLKIYFTCNGGTNWTESTPTATGTFSSGILMAKCPEVTCTSGTDIRYKAVWANQLSGNKETQLHGIGMNY
jgi:hypothetical protein